MDNCDYYHNKNKCDAKIKNNRINNFELFYIMYTTANYTTP